MPLPDEILGLGDNLVAFEALQQTARGPVGVIPFVGAGLGVPYGFPPWTPLLRELGTRYGVRDEIDAHLAAARYEEAADALVRKAGREPLNARLKMLYGERVLEGKVFRGAVTRLPALARGPVVTTNFDRLLEHVFEAAGEPFVERLSGTQSDLFAEALHTGARYLLKLHGDVLDTRNRVLTLAEYDAHYGGRTVDDVDFTRSLPKMLECIFGTRTLLFLGCSLGPDRTLLLLRRVARARGDLAPTHFALLEYPGDAQWVDRARALGEDRITPVWYPAGRHELIDPILSALLPEAEADRPVPMPPPTPSAPPRLPTDFTPTRGVGRVPWRIDAATARRQLDSERPLLVVGPKQFGKTSYLQRLFAAGFSEGDPGIVIDLRNAEARSIEGFYQWLAVEIGRSLGWRAADALAAWEATFEEFAPAQRFTELLETAVVPRVTGRLALGFENPGELPDSPALDAELFSLLRRFSQYAREQRTPEWQRVIVAVTTSVTPRAWEARLARTGVRHESSFFDLARKHWLRDLDAGERAAALAGLLPGLVVPAADLDAALVRWVGGSPHLMGHLLSDVPDRATLDRRLADPLRHATDLRALLESVCARLEALPGGREGLRRVSSEPAAQALDAALLDAMYAEGLFPQDGTGSAEGLYGVWAAFLAARFGASARA
jgi:hypothetical protein